MKQYHDLLRDIFVNGHNTTDRTGTGTRSVFGRQLRFRLDDGTFPLLTTKKLAFRWIAEELLWFISGSTNVKSLQEKGITIWDAWADKDGELGPVYGSQWRRWETNEVDATALPGPEKAHVWGASRYKTIDQLANVIERIKVKPDCRRLIVSAWNVPDIDKMKLPPCHTMFQFKVYGNKLSCQLYQRSADVFLGVPYNIASYALLTRMVAAVTGLVAHEFIHTFGDAHLYRNHFEQIEEQLSRELRPLPVLHLDALPSIDDYKMEHIRLVNYDPHPSIKGDVSV